MIGLFKLLQNRICIKDNNIFVENQKSNLEKALEVNCVIEFTEPIPVINFFENKNLVYSYKIETLQTNPDLTGQFLHSSIRILPNSAVMIDGIISKDKKVYPKWTDIDYEAIRLQPFYLFNNQEENTRLTGKGLFERGLHFSGVVTPSAVRNICICDSCNRSFTIQHFHAGFSEVEYFYSSDSKETFTISNGTIDIKSLEAIETKLPRPSNNIGTFNYYNPFRCPHCLTPYIDFENHKEIRKNEYYGNTYINQKPRYIKV